MADEDDVRTHAIWSGVITFGLVSVPVGLLSALRSERVTLHMLAPDGTPLKRRYYCSREDRPLDSEEIVRGYEIEHERFVVVTDEELEALAPKRSKEIDLRRFVPVEQLDPALFQRAYFLSPLGDTVKPYRLLASAMEASRRAGIATFVMRGKEYLVAIIAERGLLRAEILRFADEIRSPADVGLPGTAAVSKEEVAEISAAIDESAADFEPSELEDHYQRRLQQLLEEKRARGQEVIGAEELPELQEGEAEGQVVDIMELLKRSIGLEPSVRSASGAADGYADAGMPQTRQALYEKARDLDIPGRSSMTKEELAAAVKKSHFSKSKS